MKKLIIFAPASGAMADHVNPAGRENVMKWQVTFAGGITSSNEKLLK